MATKGHSIISPLLRRSNVPKLARLPHRTVLTQARRPSRQLLCRNNAPVYRLKRNFAATPSRRDTEEESAIDPREEDRESDECDVCIVGGGGILQLIGTI